MNRQFKTLADAVPHVANLFTQSGHMIPNARNVFTVAETVQLMRMYAHANIMFLEADKGVVFYRDDARKQRRYLKLYRKSTLFIQSCGKVMAEWEKDSKEKGHE